MFEDAPKDLVDDGDEPVRGVCILPFPLTDVLIQGETKELCLYEERYVQQQQASRTKAIGISRPESRNDFEVNSFSELV